jgi:hypothetical protein
VAVDVHLGDTDVRIVPRETVIDAVIRSLNESAKLSVILPPVKRLAVDGGEVDPLVEPAADPIVTSIRNDDERSPRLGNSELAKPPRTEEMRCYRPPALRLRISAGATVFVRRDAARPRPVVACAVIAAGGLSDHELAARCAGEDRIC